MSSDILSRPIDISKYSLIYASAQKNCGAAGVTIIIIKKEILGKVNRKIPTILDYQVHILNDSMYNTPPVISIFTVNQTLKYIKKLGGLEKIKQLNEEKARLLYAEIDRNKIFKTTVLKKDRSIMNVCFVMEDHYNQLENDFSEYAFQNGIIGIKGHRSVGGFRASIYNAVTIDSVHALIKCMRDFEQLHIH
ncbi:phosphoserine aminotransferase, putative [Entamoeba dispar SAW760]|nr:phosphoserine aminotransferase, putative [Entamoeba dispar SAW760]EDR22010.1 phosphoserine aminotransferase, putative [Entamoeba dispar SAW760]|eukprot:EDR22010.1 phosphoserine aminotransferase, putative [Entamoeba dispar SAW760]